MNLLAYGEFPDNPNDYSASNLLLPRGAIINGRFDEIHPVDLTAPDEIQEFVTHSWYTYGNGNNDKGLHPWDGLTEPQLVMGEHYKGTKTFIEQVDESAKYSWIKSPRWKGHAMEVGPLARYLIGYHQNKPEFKEPVDQLLSVLKLPKEALFSTLGRTAARALESVWAGNTLQYFFDRLMRNLKSGDTATANVTLWEPDTWPTSAKGVGFSEAPRGALGHWIKIENQKIDSYQCVVPTTWNAGPRDDKGQIGAYEAALMGTKLAVPDQPLEILRTLHSSIPAWPAPPMLLIIMEGSWSGFRYDDDDSEVSMHLKEITSQGYYIYEAPVRLWHWITALSIVVLAVTGYFIGRPLPSIQGEATFMFWMGWIRLIHFTTAYIFTVALLFRIYWACVGNEYAREMFLVPFWRRAWRKGVISEIRWYFFLEKEAHRYYGHNPVAGLAVMFYFWMSVLMVCSGFALYGEGLGTDSWAYQWFGWMIRLTGNDSLALHFWHRLGMWFIIAFVIAHVYTAIREDIMSRQSVISVMISGWRWFR